MPSSKLELAFRWAARVGAAASLLLLSAFIFGDAEQSQRALTATEWIGLAFFPVGVILGFLIAFRYELTGGAITAFSLGGIYAWCYVVSGKPNAGPWFALFAAPGFLFLIAGALARARQRARTGLAPSMGRH